MHTRRIASFLLGVWIGCNLFMALLVLAVLRLPEAVLSSAPPSAVKLIEKLGPENVLLLLRYQSSEQVRSSLDLWEIAQIPLALALAACLLLGVQRRILPLLLCGLMLAVVLFEHFGLTPELISQGRLTDFAPGGASGDREQLWALARVYLSLDAVKLLLGGVLTSYLFVFYSGKRVRKKADEDSFTSVTE
jgi:hypothetical protein